MTKAPSSRGRGEDRWLGGGAGRRRPAAAERTVCPNGPRGVGLVLRELVLGEEQLSIGIECIRQLNDAGYVRLLRKVARALGS